ncbi:MAG TPA: metallophosphoesterase family protein [Bryobacterales bacterium]|nr:metallophosphoesterase family protein [Bryobacterales bacterium]
MRYLILSDIHSNWEALEAVLAAAQGLYDKALCLGDLVGYGADPNPVAEWVRASVAVVIRGNHDKACSGLESLEWFNEVARDAALWTLHALTPENLQYLVGLAKGPVDSDGMTLVHGSILDEDEYVVSPREAAQVFPYLQSPLTLFGHTHIQGGFVENRGQLQIVRPQPNKGPQYLEIEADERYLLNPGSVGQPRDGDWRSAFVLYDSEEKLVVFHRVEYDLAKAQEKIRAAGLPQHLAARLSVGR